MEVLAIDRHLSAGARARKLRVLLGLTQQELADTVRVSREEVDLFEHDFPVTLDVRSRLLKVLWTAKAKRQ